MPLMEYLLLWSFRSHQGEFYIHSSLNRGTYFLVGKHHYIPVCDVKDFLEKRVKIDLTYQQSLTNKHLSTTERQFCGMLS